MPATWFVPSLPKLVNGSRHDAHTTSWSLSLPLPLSLSHPPCVSLSSTPFSTPAPPLFLSRTHTRVPSSPLSIHNVISLCNDREIHVRGLPRRNSRRYFPVPSSIHVPQQSRVCSPRCNVVNSVIIDVLSVSRRSIVN